MGCSGHCTATLTSSGTHFLIGAPKLISEWHNPCRPGSLRGLPWKLTGQSVRYGYLERPQSNRDVGGTQASGRSALITLKAVVLSGDIRYLSSRLFTGWLAPYAVAVWQPSDDGAGSEPAGGPGDAEHRGALVSKAMIAVDGAVAAQGSPGRWRGKMQPGLS